MWRINGATMVWVISNDSTWHSNRYTQRYFNEPFQRNILYGRSHTHTHTKYYSTSILSSCPTFCSFFLVLVFLQLCECVYGRVLCGERGREREWKSFSKWFICWLMYRLIGYTNRIFLNKSVNSVLFFRPQKQLQCLIFYHKQDIPLRAHIHTHARVAF